MFLISLSLLLLANHINGQTVHNIRINAGESYEGIQNPEYPNGVMQFQSAIQWNLEVDSGSTIKVLCDDIRMGQSEPWTPECKHVYISFDEGRGEKRVCGYNEASTRYDSKGSRLTVKLISIYGTGFVKCTAFSIQEPVPEYINLEPKGGIVTIKLPENLGANFDRVWILRSTPSTRISLQCQSDLEDYEPCYKEAIIVDTGSETKEICGNREETIFTNSNYGKVRIQASSNGKYTKCIVQAITGPNANEFLNVKSEEVDSSEFGITRGRRGTSCDCGRRFVSPRRIVFGKEALENEFTWMVLLNVFTPIGNGLMSKKFCGGSIITRRHVLTAAHCVIYGSPVTVNEPENIYIRLAEHHKVISSGKEVELRSKEVFVHEEYLNIRTHDIALIFTESAIEFSELIGPVCLTRENIPLINRRINIMGWGVTERRTTSDVLRKSKSVVVSSDICDRIYPEFEICTVPLPSSTCYGDSGGPIVMIDQETNRYNQIALISRGTQKICEKGFGIHTHVPSFYNWIQNIIRRTDPSATTCHKV